MAASALYIGVIVKQASQTANGASKTFRQVYVIVLTHFTILGLLLLTAF